MDWVDDLHSRHGENPAGLFEEYKQRVAEEDAAKPREFTKGMARLVTAWESKNWQQLEADGWLTADHLASEATRLLIAAWDIEDTAAL